MLQRMSEQFFWLYLALLVVMGVMLGICVVGFIWFVLMLNSIGSTMFWALSMGGG